MDLTILDTLRHYSEALLDLIYPPHIKCMVCNRYLMNRIGPNLCCECMENISFITRNIFQSNELTEHFFHKAIAVAEYKGAIRDLVFRLKYYDATYLSRDIAQMMTNSIKAEEIYGDMLMAVPLHPQREKERGYNQSHLLAKFISRNLDIHYENNNLVRIKNTKAMHNLSKNQRSDNLRNAFQIRDRQAIEGKDILLIDDIFTTGTTADACSKVLMEGGAKSVTLVTFARGV